MTRLINIDNGGSLADFCLIDGQEVRHTKTLTTPARGARRLERVKGLLLRLSSSSARRGPDKRSSL
jgi:N-methylhydantoinase A/oxoprolinase/acetone carboxylase beta subunit